MSNSKQTALHAEHEALNALFTDFGGWDMPLRYGNELEEHHAVRNAAGLFDLSHMGEIRVLGPDAATFVNTALVSNLSSVPVGKAKYSLICNEKGGIIDDLIVYRLAENEFFVVPNAGNAAAVFAALQEGASGHDVQLVDETNETSLIAVQGPRSELILKSVVDAHHHSILTEMPYYAASTVTLNGVEVLVARTGYTGEDGFEIYVANDQAVHVWRSLLAAGAEHGLVPAGLACRDSLRLEAGMPLYGNELSIDGNPFAAGLGQVVSFKKDEHFVGRDALAAINEQPAERVLVGLKGSGRRAARSGYRVFDGEREVGVVTSGLLSPTLGYPIALAYVDRVSSQVGTQLAVDLRGKNEPFEVVALPFYTRKK